MNVEIICVGTELLLGDILNTNAQSLSKSLALLGMNVHFQTCVGDNHKRLMSCLEISSTRSDIAITIGGLGPTKDDLTKETIAKFFNKNLFFDEEAFNQLSNRLHARGHKEISDSNRKQAYLIEGCIPMYNTCGTAPGCITSNDDFTIIMLPGPPNECLTMFSSSVEPYLKQISNYNITSKTLNIFGIGEAYVNDIVSDLLDSPNPTLAPYAKNNYVELRISYLGNDNNDSKKQIEIMEDEICSRLNENIFSTGNISLEQTLYNILERKHYSLLINEEATYGIIYSLLKQNDTQNLIYSCSTKYLPKDIKDDIYLTTSRVLLIDDKQYIKITITFENKIFEYTYNVLNNNDYNSAYRASYYAINYLRLLFIK